MPWYRCTLEDDEREVTITIDVLADANGTVDRALMFYGYYRANTETDNAPFALGYDGRIDWGSTSRWIGTLPIHGKRISKDAIFHYASYETNAAFERGEADWSADLVVQSYRNHAE